MPKAKLAKLILIMQKLTTKGEIMKQGLTERTNVGANKYKATTANTGH